MQTGLNALLESGTKPFNDSEQDLALKFLAEEGKVMTDGGVVYQI